MQNSYQKIKNIQNKQTIRIIVAGGDGTVGWLIDEMLSNQIDLQYIPIGMSPFGTINDFSRILGWGDSINKILELDYFQKYSINWLDAIQENFDIWTIKIETYDDGYFVNTINQKKAIIKTNNLKKTMINYCSIGADARIMQGIDKNKSQSQLLNCCVFYYEGSKKQFLKNEKIEQVLEYLKNHDQNNVDEIEDSDEDLNEIDFQNQFYGDNLTLCALNIDNYMGRQNNLWAQAKVESNKIKKNEYQTYNDNQIEFILQDTVFKQNIDKILKGNPKKGIQGKGPFEIKFKQNINQKKNTYIQIDGECYQVISPKQMTIQFNQKIKVLINKNSINQ